MNNQSGIPRHIIKKIQYSNDGLAKQSNENNKKHAKLLLDYPTLYAVEDEGSKNKSARKTFKAYVVIPIILLIAPNSTLDQTSETGMIGLTLQNQKPLNLM